MLLSQLRGWTIGAFSVAICLVTAIPAYSEEQKCDETDTGLSLPKGFCANIFADKVGHARQLVVTPHHDRFASTSTS